MLDLQPYWQTLGRDHVRKAGMERRSVKITVYNRELVIARAYIGGNQ